MTAPTVGILGAGQLGRMLALAGAPLGVRTLCVDPATDPPAAVAAEVRTAPFTDPDALAELARRCDVVTIEVEHVPVEALAWLAERLPVHPSPAVVAVAQDRLREKLALRAAGVATAPWSEPAEAAFANGTIVKTRLGGYDGRGQVRVPPGGDVAGAAASLGVPCIAEGVVAFDREVSVLAARSTSGEVAVWPVVENRHRDGILRESLAPAPGLTPALQAEAEAQVRSLLAELDHVGVLALELFDVGGLLVANEIAPRVHNSGHWTIEGACTSQFEQHLRAVLGWPLGDTSAVGCSAMVNLVGGEPDPAALLALPGVHLHTYGKAPRRGRKVGHVTVSAESVAGLEPALGAVRSLVATSEDG